MISSLVWLLLIVVVASIVYWVIDQLALPKPVKVVALGLLAIIAVVFIAKSVIGIL